MVQRALQQEPRYRIEIRGHRLAPQPHRLQRNRPAPRERIQHPRRAPAERFSNLCAEPVELAGSLGRALTPPMENPAPRLFRPLAPTPGHVLHAPGHPAEQLPSTLGRPRIAQQRRQQRRPARRQRPPRRPDVQGRDVPVPDVLLVHGVERHLLERKGGFDEAAVGQCSFPQTTSEWNVVHRVPKWRLVSTRVASTASRAPRCDKHLRDRIVAPILPGSLGGAVGVRLSRPFPLRGVGWALRWLAEVIMSIGDRETTTFLRRQTGNFSATRRHLQPH